MKVLTVSKWLVIGVVVLTLVAAICFFKNFDKSQDTPPPIEIILPEGELN